MTRRSWQRRLVGAGEKVRVTAVWRVMRTEGRRAVVMVRVRQAIVASHAVIVYLLLQSLSLALKFFPFLLDVILQMAVPVLLHNRLIFTRLI